MGTKQTCTRCGKTFVSHGPPLCPSCEKAADHAATAKTARERRQQRHADAKHKHQPGSSNG